MSDLPQNTISTVIPCLRYRDAPAAIDWLCQAFGFEKGLVVPDEHQGIAHAQLSFGNGMVMLGSTDEAGNHSGTEYGHLIKQPNEVGGNTQTTYLVVADTDQVYRRAKAAGAEIVLDIKDEEYGGRGFSCRDPEGHVWSIGSYNPW